MAAKAVFVSIFLWLLIIVRGSAQLGVDKNEPVGVSGIQTGCRVKRNGNVTADCSHLQCTTVPQNLPEELTSLDLSHNDIEVLRNDSFDKYKKLCVLSIAYNNISIIEINAFHHLSKLQKLILSNNNISDLPQRLFEKNDELSVLILAFNHIQNLSHNFDGFCNGRKSHLHSQMFEQHVHVTEINLSLNDITSLDKEDFSSFMNCSISKLRLDNNFIQDISPEAFIYLSHVADLSLRGMKLKVLNLQSFVGCHGVQKVSLPYSGIQAIVPLNISDIPQNPHNKMPKIEYLDLEGNKIQTLVNNTFAGFVQLKVVSLKHNGIQELPINALTNATKLEKVILSQNKFSNLYPNIFSVAHSLKYVNLSDCQISTISHLSWGASSLQGIDLSYNNIQFLGVGMFYGLRSLRTLDLSHNNNLKQVSGNTFNALDDLQILILSYANQIILNGGFATMHQLKYLDISHARQLTIVPQFANTSSLMTLIMAHSSITAQKLNMSMGSFFSGLISLQRLNLQGNDMSRLHDYPDVFSPLQNLKTLDLSMCSITTLVPHLFFNLKSLRALYINNNHINKIKVRAFVSLTGLRVLLLHHNSITKINDIFANLSNLTTLTLQDNKISTIPANTKLPQSLVHFNIAKNPLACTCQLAWFRGWLEKTNADLTQADQIMCSPKSFKDLKDKSIWSFHPEEYCGINVTLVTCAASTFVFVLCVTVVVHHKRKWLKYQFFLLKIAMFGYHDCEYDLNVMYLEADEWWVNDRLRPALQERMPHIQRVAYGDNDLPSNMFCLNAIDRLIGSSFKTVLLLSNQSANDIMTMTKLRMAMEHANDSRLDKVILIFLEDIVEEDLPHLVRLFLSKNKPYLYWTQDNDDEELFWARFEESMRANRVTSSVVPI